MKLNKTGHLLAASALSLAVAGFLTACATLTQDFVFVPSAKAAGTDNYGEMDVFEINRESGAMRQIPTSPFPSGGRNPVAEVLSTDNTNLYVANRDDNTIVQFAIGNDGKLYPLNTTNTPGSYPVSVSITGSNLFVVDTYQPLPTCSTLEPCSGSLGVFPMLAATGNRPDQALQDLTSLGTPLGSCTGLEYQPLTLTGTAAKDIVTPVSVTSKANGSDATNVYVAAYDSTANTGYVFGYKVTTQQQQCTVDGQQVAAVIPTVTALSGSPWKAGVYPSNITTDATGAYVYVTDSTSSNVLGFAASSGSLTPLPGSPYPAGGKPSAIVVDQTSKYAYVTNAQDSTVTAYTISSGDLTRVASYTTGTQPVAIGIDPSLNQYVFTANFLGNSVSGFQIQSDGTLINSKGITYPSNDNPTAVAAIPHQLAPKK